MNKKKIHKIIIKLITGLCLIVYFTTSGIIGFKPVKANTNYSNYQYTQAYKTINTINKDNKNTISIAVEKEMNLMDGLEQIGKTYKYKDIEFLREIHEVEKLYNLPKHVIQERINEFKSIIGYCY